MSTSLVETHTLTMAEISEIAGRAVDIPTQPAAEVEADIQSAVKLVNDRIKGAHVVAAIGALHGQHTRDGRPSRYIPEAR